MHAYLLIFPAIGRMEHGHFLVGVQLVWIQSFPSPYLTKVKEPCLLYNLSDPVGWAYKIYQQHLCRGVDPTTKCVLDITLNNLMVRFQ